MIILVLRILHTLHVCHNQLFLRGWYCLHLNTDTHTHKLYLSLGFMTLPAWEDTRTYDDASSSQLIYLIYSFIRAKEKFLLASLLLILCWYNVPIYAKGILIHGESHKCERDRLFGCLSIFVMCVFLPHTCVLEKIYYFHRQKCIKDAKIKCETFV